MRLCVMQLPSNCLDYIYGSYFRYLPSYAKAIPYVAIIATMFVIC